MKFHGHVLPLARALPGASSVGFAVLSESSRLGASFRSDAIPGGWRPKTGVLKRMNSAFMGHRLSRKKTLNLLAPVASFLQNRSVLSASENRNRLRRAANAYGKLRVDARTTNSAATLRWVAPISRFSSTALMPSITIDRKS